VPVLPTIRGDSGLRISSSNLMFKSTKKIKSGEFTRSSPARGRDNAQTTHDSTYVFPARRQGAPARVMELEADRMINLRLLVEEEVRTERSVILESAAPASTPTPLRVLDEQHARLLYLTTLTAGQRWGGK